MFPGTTVVLRLLGRWAVLELRASAHQVSEEKYQLVVWTKSIYLHMHSSMTHIFTLTGLDGRVVIWDLQNQEDLSQYLCWRISYFPSLYVEYDVLCILSTGILWVNSMLEILVYLSCGCGLNQWNPFISFAIQQ